jgi:hypothetical protein
MMMAHPPTWSPARSLAVYGLVAVLRLAARTQTRARPSFQLGVCSFVGCGGRRQYVSDKNGPG